MKRNITLSLDVDLIKKARIISGKRMTSVSQLLSSEVARVIEEDERYEESHRLALSLLEKEHHLGGKITISREQLHER